MNEGTSSKAQFFIKNCSLAAIATGERASSLVELRDRVATVEEGCLYHHFWGGRMKPQFVHSQHHNDFASWVFHRLHDQILAEKLSVIDPTEFATLEALRLEILETIDNRLDDYEIVLWTKKEDRFHFITSSILIFDSPFILLYPEDLPQVIPMLSSGSIFYHFIDARRRTPDKSDDFSVWLKMFGNQYQILIENIQMIDPYFLSLTELKEELTKVIENYFDKKGQL